MLSIGALAMNPPTLETVVSSLPPPPPPATSSSLSTAVSEISSLLRRADSVFCSLPISYDETNPQALLRCAFNPNHRIPSSSLFSHYLNCPCPVSLAHNFRYNALTFHSVPTPFLPGDSSQISVSLEPYNGYAIPENGGSFYEGCPGPVTPSFRPPPSFNLPVILANECRDFVEERIPPMEQYSDQFIRFLPSEICAIQSEVEAWEGNLPVEYSLRIVRAILNFRCCKLSLKQWIVCRSASYGVAVDSTLVDHILLLIRLCFKVACSETFRCNEQCKMEKDDSLATKFPLPMLLDVMKWLCMQLSILYGEAQAKMFVVELLKECILESSLRASLFPLGHENAENIVSINYEAVWIDTIFISQVAAAVAALQERSTVEEKIRYLRYSHMKSAYQRNMEHAHVSNFANEERLKRSDYRPVIEHDAFFGQTSSNQETNKLKTREELLAEERDYKRRRISYRGKKQKRGTVEVMRDIIEEYMEELKKAGAVMCESKGMQENMDALSENPDVDNAILMPKKSEVLRNDSSRGQKPVGSTTDTERMSRDRDSSAEILDRKIHSKSTKQLRESRNQDLRVHSIRRSHEYEKRSDGDEQDYEKWRKEAAIKSPRRQRQDDNQERRYREGASVRDPEKRGKDDGLFGDKRLRKSRIRSSDDFDRYDPMGYHGSSKRSCRCLLFTPPVSFVCILSENVILFSITKVP